MRNKILVVLFGLLILVLLNFFQSEVKNFFYSLSAPFQNTLFRAGDYISDFFEALVKTKDQKRGNEELRRKVQGLMAENVRLKEIEKENKILREMLKVNPPESFEFFISRIISKDIISPDSILIKGGSENGIKKGMPIITQEKVLVGKIEKTYNNFSKVNLISSKNFSFGVKILKAQNLIPISLSIGEGAGIYGLTRGKGNLKVYLDKVQLRAEIKERDILITAALGGTFPEGLLVGEIIKVRKSDLEPFQTAEVSPFFDIKELENLFIITKW